MTRAQESGGVQSTSLDSFRELPQEVLATCREKVFDKLSEIGPASNKQVAEALGWSINRETPRMMELRKRGRVACAGKRYDAKSRRWERVWEVVS